MVKFRVTYEVVTPESAEHGDADERGFVSPGNWHHDDVAEMSLREACGLVSPRSMEDCGRWFSEIGERLDYQTGAAETRSLHPPKTITAASYGRLRRVMCGRD